MSTDLASSRSARRAPAHRPDSGRCPQRPTRIAVIGAGWVSREVWVPLLAAHDAFQVTAVVDPNREAAVEAAPDQRTTRVLARPEEVDRAVADAAIIALPNHLHLPVASGLLGRDIPVFVEKPVCRTLMEAQELALAGLARHEGQAPGARLLAWSAARHRGDVRRLEELVPSLGELRRVGLTWSRAAGIPQRTGWFTDRRLAGGGALLDLGWHLLDVGMHLLGWPQMVHATGTLSADWMGRPDATADWSRRAGGVPAGGSGQPVEDTAHGLLVTDTGVGIWLETRWASHQPHDVTTITVEGTEGVATLRATFGFSPHRVERSSLTVLRRGREELVPLPSEPVGVEYRRQVDVLARLLCDPAGGQATGSMPEVLSIAAAIDQIYSSARTSVPADRTKGAVR